MYNSPIEIMQPIRQLAIKTAEQGILEAVWNMGFKVDPDQLTCAMTQDKKRYEYAYDQGWHDCEDYYKKKLAEIVSIATREDRK